MGGHSLASSYFMDGLYELRLGGFSVASHSLELTQLTMGTSSNEGPPMEKPPQPWPVVSLKGTMGTMGWEPQIDENDIFGNFRIPFHGPHGLL